MPGSGAGLGGAIFLALRVQGGSYFLRKQSKLPMRIKLIHFPLAYNTL